MATASRSCEPSITFTLGDDVLETVADILHGRDGTALSELGVFYAPTPPLAEQTLSTALIVTPEALGVSSWVLSALYRAAKSRIIASRRDLRAATSILVATPDYATAWAVRREELMRQKKEMKTAEIDKEGDKELAFCSLILRRSPKSVEAWTHRAWVLRVFGWTDERVRRELIFGLRAASAAPGNYYAGVHRARALRQAQPAVLASQVILSRNWLRRHVSDCSGWWYHTCAICLVSVLDDQEFLIQILDDELNFAIDMDQRYGAKYDCVRNHKKRLFDICKHPRHLAQLAR
jgi:Protein prenyltransferase alpha subunit repeat